MAQAGFTPISLYFSSTASAVPSSGNLANGELGLNIADMKLYAKNSAGTVTLLASSSGASGTVSSVAVSGGTTGLTTSGGPITTSGTITLAGTLGTANGGTGLTSFTSGGVVYASSSSALATGSALTFDGSLVEVFGGTTVSYRFNANRGTDDTTQGLRFGFSGIDGYRTSATLASAQTQLSFTQTGSNGTRTPYYIGTNGESVWAPGSGTSPSEAMRLTSTGLGIGTNSPAYKLDLYNTTNFAGRWANATRGGYLYLDSGGPGIFNTAAYGGEGMYFHAGSNYTAFLTNSSERMRIDSAGKVGIGTSAPNNELEVVTSSNPSIALTSTSASLYSYFGMTSGTVGAQLYTFGQSYSAVYPAGSTALANNTYGIILNANNASGILRFQTADTERFRIGAAGQLGIGGATYGTAGQVLTSGGASAAPTWSTVSGGGLTVIGTLTLSAGTQSGSINLPSGWDTTYKYLQLVIQGNYVSAGGTGAGIIRFNNDTGSVYSYSWFNMTTGTNQSSQTFIQFGSPGNNDAMRCSFQLSYNANMSSAYRVQLQGGFSRNNVFHSAGFAYDTSSVPTSINFPQPFGSGYYLAGVYTVYGVS
jgi:hypothetical protein